MAITSRVTKQISSQVTKRNPRPRKYASQAERQAAYRARNVMLEFRAEPKTADNITRISETLGYPRSDVLLSMVKFALTNHDWARFGLTHKTIPTYKENPMQSWMIVNKQTGEAVLETYNKDILSKLNTEKYEAIPALKYLVALNKKIKENPTMKPASPAQLAARKRFAEMARSGAFKKATKRKVNPLPPVVETILEQMGGNKFMVMTGARPVVHGPHMLTFKLPTNQSKANYLDVIHNPGKDLYTMTFRRVSNRGMDSKNLVEYDDVYADQLQPMFEKVTGMYTTLGTMGRKVNPAKKTVSQKISQLVHEGYPQRQAVAVALSEQRAGKVKRNPTDIHLAGNYYGKVSKDGTGSFWTYVVNRVKEVNPDGSLYETDDVVGDFKAKHYVTMKGAINALDKYKAKLSGVKRNPAKVKYRNLATDLKGDQRVGYSVHLASQPGHNAIAWFSKKADALEVAQEAADRTGKPLAVTRVQNYFGAM